MERDNKDVLVHRSWNAALCVGNLSVDLAGVPKTDHLPTTHPSLSLNSPDSDPSLHSAGRDSDLVHLPVFVYPDTFAVRL